MKRHQIFFFCITLATMLLASCSSDYHYAKQYLRKHKHKSSKATEQIYVYLPKKVSFTNTSASIDTTNLSPEQQDSVHAELNAILSRLNDSIFLSQFSQSLLYTLSKSHIPVIVVQEERLLPPPSRDALILDIYALEAEEFVEPSRSDFYTRKGTYYAYDHNIRHFSGNVWLQMDYDTSFYFYNIELSDDMDFHGVVLSMKNEKANMQVEQKKINVNDAYAVARQMGTDCAVMYIEKILHDYVRTKNGTNTWYLFYDHHDNDIHLMIPYESGTKVGFEKLK